MPSVAVSRAPERAALLTRALGAACPVQIVMTALWLLVPHAGRAHEGWVVALTLATTPLYAVVVLRHSIVLSRVAMNVTGLVGILAVSCLVWAGGGLPSGFVLMALWFLPITVCSLPRRDVAAHVALLVAGSAPPRCAVVRARPAPPREPLGLRGRRRRDADREHGARRVPLRPHARDDRRLQAPAAPRTR